MAVGPALPWRAASARDAAQPPADPGVDRRAHARRVRARAARAASPTCSRSRSAPSRSRASAARSSSACARAGARRREALPDRDGAHRARQPAPLRRAARARRVSSCSRSALATTSGYTTKREVQLSPGQSTTVRGFTVTYLRTRDRRRRAQKTTIKADVRVRRGSSSLGTFAPAISSYPELPRRHRHAVDPHRSVARRVPHARLGADARERRGGAITLGVQVGTFVMWLWIGGADHGARHRCSRSRRRAGAGAVVPTRRRRADEPRDARRGRDVTRGTAIALDRARASRSCSSRSAWCSRCSTAPRRRCRGSCRSTSRRRRSTSTTLDGKPIERARRSPGKTYVVNFWNSWCIPCRQEAARARRRSTPRTAASPTSRWSASCATTIRAPIRGYVADERRSTWPVAFDPERQRRARLRHDRPARDLRDLARRRRRVRQPRPGRPTPSSRRGSQAARAGGVCA